MEYTSARFQTKTTAIITLKSLLLCQQTVLMNTKTATAATSAAALPNPEADMSNYGRDPPLSTGLTLNEIKNITQNTLNFL